jgi:alkylation response protein AidB-like acyl-CoA dehydrogenase
MERAALSSETHRAFRALVRGFIEREVTPHALDWEKTAHVPVHLLERMGESGLIGLSLPEQVGGGGRDFWHEVILAEELARSRALGWALSVLVQSNMVAPLLFQLGSSEQHEKILKPALRGRFYLALAATDADSGSDLAAIGTTAKPDADRFVLNGEKRYISNGTIAEQLVVLARTANEKNIWSLGLFMVPGNAPGVTRTKLRTSGLKTGDLASITFHDCVLTREQALGDPSRGFFYLMRGLQRERLMGAVALNALALFVWEETLAFLQQRERFGEALSKKQVIRHRMVELRATIEASRQFTYSVCEAFFNEQQVDKEILMLKIFSYETCQQVIDACVHLRGAEAFLSDHWFSHVRQDAQAFTLAAGTSEIMRDLLAGMFNL